ncbi:hypothetical protein [uncultured Prevotella sp.]|jgi:hypothetical protein|uniref:hypothetical protein n=1 Tax=uncultured Prevotella sp. TaxID=159272 RepID=UPI0027E39406|nr:hypothetical protein [uncultured Prevotella sp.]
MKKIMFNDKYGLTRAVLEGRKTQTRRIAYTGNATIIDCGICVEPKNIGRAILLRGIDEVAYSRYNVGEEVAIAQAYCELVSEVGINEAEINKLRNSKGWTNKMFVKDDLMPHRIRITDIRAERLQEISDEDCIAEGIKKNPEVLRGMWEFSYIKDVTLKFEMSTTTRGAYAKLIDHISGKGTWASNPYVFVYEFELIK